MKTRTYQIALALTVSLCLVLAAALAFVFARGPKPLVQAVALDSVLARGPEKAPQAARPEGATPAAGESPLTPIQLSPQRLQEIGVTTALAEMKNLNGVLHVPGNVDIDEQRISYVQTRYAGWIQNVSANATYQYVRKGQRLFTIYSPDIVSSQQEYLLAKQSQHAFAQDAHGMTTHESGWLLDAAVERLRQFGIPQQQIADLEQSGKVQREIAVDSPVSGYITERNALPNAYVQPEMKLYTIADLSTVWVYANVSQGDVGRLKPGNSAKVTVDAYPNRNFNGRIDQILPQVDPTTRTVRVRLVLANPGIALKPGMYVNVDIDCPLGRQLVVPASAVLQSGTRSIAFIDHGEGSLEPRVIETGPSQDDSIVVLKGLKAGDRVVSSANFLVDSESQLQASQGAPPPPVQAPAASSPAAPAAQIKADLSTEPSPPQKGANTVRVRLTGADGKPLTGAQVTVTFFMPAMPAMGMAAMSPTAQLTSKGNGMYEGPLQLDSGGTWQVTITVRRGGQALAVKRMSVSAAGGM